MRKRLIFRCIFDLMDNLGTKYYLIKGKSLKVDLKRDVVSIDFTPFTSKAIIWSLYQDCSLLIAEIKRDYKSFYQRDLNISNASFRAEIWGHLIAYQISLWMKKNIQIGPIQKLAKFAAFRSGVIDCGDAKVDTNRWFWDVVGWLFFRKYK